MRVLLCRSGRQVGLDAPLLLDHTEDQLDPAVLAALPAAMQREIKLAFMAGSRSAAASKGPRAGALSQLLQQQPHLSATAPDPVSLASSPHPSSKPAMPTLNAEGVQDPFRKAHDFGSMPRSDGSMIAGVPQPLQCPEAAKAGNLHPSDGSAEDAMKGTTGADQTGPRVKLKPRPKKPRMDSGISRFLKQSQP